MQLNSLVKVDIIEMETPVLPVEKDVDNVHEMKQQDHQFVFLALAS